jgi:hypothetical protein
MQIFDHQQEWLGVCSSQEDVCECRKDAALLLLRIQGEQGREICQFRQVLDLLWKQGEEHARRGSQNRGNLGGGAWSQEGTKQIKQGSIRAGMIGGEALSTEQLEVLSFGRPSQFGHQPRFADASFPTEQDNASLSTCRRFETIL